MRCQFKARLSLFLMLCLPTPCLGSPSWLSIAQDSGQDSYREFEEWVERGEFRKALQLAEKALSAARLAGDPLQEAWALDKLGDAYFYLGDRAKALQVFRAALAKMREMDNSFGEATELKNVGIAYMNLDRYEEALEFLQDALDLSRQLNDSHLVSSSLENLGITYFLLGAHRLALATYERTMEVARENQDEDQMHHLHVDMGYLYLDRNQPAQALEHFQRALNISERLDHFLAQIYALEGISLAYAALDKMDAAISTGRRTLNLSLRIEHEDGEAHALWNLGYNHLDIDPQIALDYFQQAQAIWKVNEKQTDWWQYFGLGLASLRQGDSDQAIDYYEKAVGKVESDRSRIVSEHHRATFLGKNQNIYLEFIELLMDRHEQEPSRGDDARAFHVFERSRARSMVEALVQSRADISQDLDPQLHRREVQLSSRIAGLQKRLIVPELPNAEQRLLLRQLGDAEFEFNRLIGEIKRRNPKYAALKYPQPLTVRQAQALLNESQALLTYALTDHAIFAFLLSADTFKAQRLPVAPELLRARIQNYVDLMAQGDGQGTHNIGRRLYLDLMAPLEDHLSSQIRQLIIIPSGVLNYLPFETLIPSGPHHQQPPTGHSANDSRYLLERFAISYSLSATMLAELMASQRRLDSKPRADLLVFAEPVPAEALLARRTSRKKANRTRALYDDERLEIPALPYTAEEASAIEVYAGPQSKIFTGANASEQRVKSHPLDTYRVIHFATHGLISQRNSARSALLLAPGDEEIEDGFLQAREIYRLRFASDLVVLSGCRTAQGQILAGEGVLGLARASLCAGTQSVVASLWDIDDKQTAEFMASFYSHLATGQSKAEALRATKLGMLRKGTTAPRQWAPFILIGEPGGVIPLSAKPSWSRSLDTLWWLIIPALLALGLTARFVASRLTS